MFLPLHDRNKLRHIHFQRTTIGLIAANCLAFLWQVWMGEIASDTVIRNAGVTPSSLLAMDGGVLVPDFPIWATPFTYMFLHADWYHLLANMAFLWVFGDNVEDALGHIRFLVFYLICGATSGLVHALVNPVSDIPLIGASGAMSGVFAAYVLLYPRVRVWVIPLPFIPLLLPILLVVVAWLAFQIYFIVTMSDTATAWWAHMGGFVAGAILVIFMRRPGIPLLGPVNKGHANPGNSS